MASVSAVVLHRPAGSAAGPLERRLAEARRRIGVDLAERFRAAGAIEARVLAGPPDDTPFGARLRALLGTIPAGHGLILAGAGSAALARVDDVAPFVATAATGERRARTNNRYSADLVAVGDPVILLRVPDLPSDNALPRWLGEVAGIPVADEGARWRLSVDVDSPLDLELLARRPRGSGDADGATVRDRLAAVAAVLADRRAEVLVAGRTSATSLRWLERRMPARIRAFVEERGLRASSRLALEGDDGARRTRVPRSILGALLDAQGPEALGSVLAGLADAAIIDSRVLLAHRLGADERCWPPPEDRFASDLLLSERIADPWLRALTEAARDAPIPIVLGGHTLVGPGVRLVAGWRRS